MAELEKKSELTLINSTEVLNTPDENKVIIRKVAEEVVDISQLKKKKAKLQEDINFFNKEVSDETCRKFYQDHMDIEKAHLQIRINEIQRRITELTEK